MAMEPSTGVQSDDWSLVDSSGHHHRLPKTMLFMGREECDIVVKTQSVDKRHAVITFDHYLDKFKIKDLSTSNGTYVNEQKIQDQEYVTLEHMDSVRLGNDSMTYHMERVPSSGVPPHNVHPDKVQSDVIPASMPHWATRELPHMAECQGCIAEQRIAHTCGNHNLDTVISYREQLHLTPETQNIHSHHNLMCQQSNSHPQQQEYSDNVIKHTQGHSKDSPSEEWNQPQEEFSSHLIPMEDEQSKNSKSNTWPRKRIRNTTDITKFFLEDISGSRMSIDDNNYACNRVLRGEGGHPDNLPPELETVKKGTPLYGQPDWWGEEDGSNQVKDISENEHPHDLSLNKSEQQPTSKEGTPSSDLPSMSSSISKDSLFNPPTPDINKVHIPVSETKTHDGGASTAFTVDFDEESPKLNMSGKSLSEFVPTKIRRSFRERKDKVLSKTLSKDSSPGTEQEPLMSPGQQKKVDELWSSPARKGRDLKRSKPVEQEPKADGKKGVQKPLHRRSLSTGGPVKAKLSRPKENGEVTPKSPKQTPQSAVTESASFLIDKMFQNDTKSPVKGRRTPRSSKQSDKCSEHVMYKESRQYEGTRSKPTQYSKDLTKSKRPVLGLQKQDSSKPAVISKKSAKKAEVLPSNGKVADVSDNVSETGTYTVEGEEPSQEEDSARQEIDTVFGVTQSEITSVTNGDICNRDDGQNKISRDLTLEEIDDDDICDLEKKRAKGPEMNSLDVEVGSSAVTELHITEEQENPKESLPNDAPTWVTQWAALTNQKTKSDIPSPTSSVSDKDIMLSPDTKKPPRVPSRKRPGTGRKLPSIPGKSPDGSSCSSRLSQSTESQSPRCLSTPRYGENNNITEKQKAVTISSHVVRHSQDTDTESVSRTKFESDIESSVVSDSNYTPKTGISGQSSGSIDTEVLLKDTETVMAAMEARMGSQSSDISNGHVIDGDENDKFSDSESMVALVNGDEGFVKSKLYSSPRESLAKTRGLQQHKPLPRMNSAGARLQAFRDRNYKRSSVTENSVVSDVLSEVKTPESEQVTDRTSEEGDTGASFNRTGSKGKGTISMTRPNRAFQLRRARADGEPEIHSSNVSEAVSLTNVSDSNSTARSIKSSTPTRAMKATNRLSYPCTKQDSARSKESLGAAIVQRSRQEPVTSSRSTASLGTKIAQKAQMQTTKSSGNLSSNFVRSDGGRFSLKLSRSLSTQDSINNVDSGNSPALKTDSKSIKSRLKTTPAYGLSVTGVGSSRSSATSQSSSRTNSPKSAEKMAWKRRKEYDPRRAVAEAKAKAKDCKVKLDSQGKPKMIRSASFTNSAELQKYRKTMSQKDNVSSPDDISCASEGASTSDSLYQRSFIPYSSRSLSSQVCKSSEEEDGSTMVKSSQDLSRGVPGRFKSAFTPPPQNSNPSPILFPLSVYKKRNSLENNEVRQSTIKHRGSHNDVQQSYDNILVSSIYQLSLKLKNNTDKTLQKLKDDQRIENVTSPSPIDDMLNQSNIDSDIPGWKSANQELAAILSNLRKTEHRIFMMQRALYPDDDSLSDSPGLSGREKREYLQEIERIRGELAGFQPINTPETTAWKDDQVSIESDCEELSAADEFF